MPEPIAKYGCWFPPDTDSLEIEFEMVRRGGQWKAKEGHMAGLGLFHHVKAAQTIVWPDEYHNRWTDLILSNYLTNRITVVMACRDATKTRTISKAVLIEYWARPDDTLVLMTSTDARGLEMRVWGDIKSLDERARDRFQWLPGNVADSKRGLFTDDISEGSGGGSRDMRRGIIGIPCLGSKGEYMGTVLKNFAGIKQKVRRLIGDELQFIPRDYLKVLDSLDSGDFRAGFLGNPIPDNGMALDEVSEPMDGWDSIGEINKTTVWKNKYQGVTINLVGTDTPNGDPKTLNAFPGMIRQADADRVAARPGGKDSLEWWSQIMGIRKAGMVSNRVLTVKEIDGYDGFKDVVWSGAKETTKIYAIDAGFGGDECVRTWLEFGEAVDGATVIAFGDQKVIPILMSSPDTPEKQIAKYAKLDCEALGIPAANLFFDAGMYATLAVELAREMSPEVNAVNFGGTATERPVSSDMFVWDEDKKERRLKTWYEHVSKFVSELYFAVRLSAQCHQLRQFPRAAAEEFGKRKWSYVSENRYELETKDDYKLRYSGQSPNHADALVIAVEGARQRGFEIAFVSKSPAKSDEKNWLEIEMDKHRDFMRKRELHAA